VKWLWYWRQSSSVAVRKAAAGGRGTGLNPRSVARSSAPARCPASRRALANKEVRAPRARETPPSPGVGVCAGGAAAGVAGGGSVRVRGGDQYPAGRPGRPEAIDRRRVGDLVEHHQPGQI